MHHVGERRSGLARERAASIPARGPPGHAEAVALADLAPALPAQDGGRVEQQRSAGPPDARTPRATPGAARAAPPRGSRRGERLGRLARQLGLDVLEDGREELALVRELVVERAARDAAPRARSPRSPRRRSRARRTARARRATSAARVASTARPCRLDIRTVCMHRSVQPVRDPSIGDRAMRCNQRSSSRPERSATATAGGAATPDRLRPRPAGQRPAVAQGRPRCWRATASADRRPTCRWARTRRPMRRDADRPPRGVAHLIADVPRGARAHDVDVIGNDTGGAICQVLVTERPERVGQARAHQLRRVRELPAARVQAA